MRTLIKLCSLVMLLSGCAVVNMVVPMDEVVTGRTVCETHGIFKYCVKEEDRNKTPMGQMVIRDEPTDQ